MAKHSHLVLISLVLLKLGVHCQSQAKLNIDVLYESLCPDSLTFVTQQLHPIWKEIAPYVNLKLIPFGKSASLENSNFVCQHGPKECEGNRIQSCVLQALPDQGAQVDFVNCFMKSYRRSYGALEQGQSCASTPAIDFTKAARCYQSDEGTKLQLIAEQDTAKIVPKFVPTIIYNREFNQQLQDASLVDFRGVVCQFITQINPDACRFPSTLRL